MNNKKVMDGGTWGHHFNFLGNEYARFLLPTLTGYSKYEKKHFYYSPERKIY